MLADWIDSINDEAPYPEVKGFKFVFDWDEIEGRDSSGNRLGGAGQGTVGQGSFYFDVIDQIVDAVEAIGKKVMLLIKFQYFGGSVTNLVGKFPHYVINSGWATAWDGVNPASPSGGLIAVANLWDADAMDVFIAANEALATRYGGNPTVEMITFGETATENLPGSGFSAASWLTQLKRWATAMRVAWPNTAARIETNYLSTDAQMHELMAHLRVEKVTGGGPDNYSRTYQSNPIFTGYNGGIDYRDTMPWCSENQRPASSSGGASATSAQVYAHNETGALSAGGSTHPNYYVWLENSDPTGGAELWSDIRDFIISIDGAANAFNPYSQEDTEPESPVVAISVVNTGSVSVADNAAVSPALGVTTNSGDLVLVFASLTTAASGRTLSCSGYTPIASFGAGNQQPLYVFAKIASAAEGNPTVTPAGSVAGNVLQAVAMVLRNTDPAVGSVLHVSHNQTTLSANNSTPINVPDLTVTEDDCLTLSVVTYQSQCSDFSTYDPNGDGGWTRRVFAVTTTGSDQTLAVYTKLQTTATAVLSDTLTITGQATGFTARAISLAIRPN